MPSVAALGPARRMGEAHLRIRGTLWSDPRDGTGGRQEGVPRRSRPWSSLGRATGEGQ